MTIGLSFIGETGRAGVCRLLTQSILAVFDSFETLFKEVTIVTIGGVVFNLHQTAIDALFNLVRWARTQQSHQVLGMSIPLGSD